MSNPVQPVTGRTLLATAWATLRADRELLLLPVVGALITLLTQAPIIILFTLLGENNATAQWFIGVLVAFGITLTSTFFAVAFAAGANMRLEGHDPTVRSALSAAWSRRVAVVQWSALSTGVGVLLRFVEQRFSVAGKIFSVLGNVTWAVASYFSVPVLATEEGSGWAALRLSAEAMQRRWGKVVRVEVRGLLLQVVLLVPFFAGFGGAFILFESHPALAAALLGFSVLGMLVGGLIIVAVLSIARVALYRYATGRDVPGFDTDMLHAAVRTAT